MKRILLTVILLSLNTVAFADTEFRLMTYNALKFDVDDVDRQANFATVFANINPDVVLMQEIFTAAGADLLLAALNASGDDYARAEFLDGPDTDHMLFYRKSVLQLLDQRYIETSLRSFAEYTVRIDGNEVKLYSAHLKASSGSVNAQKRLEEVAILRAHLNQFNRALSNW